LQIAILATGHEVVAGEVLNTNTQKIAYDLSSQGLDISTHMACRDVLDEMLLALDSLSNHEIIITIGGLGPTCDDITRFAVAKHLKLDLVEHDKAQKHIHQYLKHHSFIPIENRKQECLFPADAKLLDNPNGTALGAWIEKNKKIIVMLPGPPRECLPMWEHFVLPELIKRMPASMPWLRWLAFGSPEAALINDLDDLLKDKPHELGYRCSMPYVEVKVKTDDAYREGIILELDQFFKDKQLLKNQIASLALKAYLHEKSINLSICDQLTGGLLEAQIMTPELFKRVSFHEKKPMHFSLSGLHDFWHQLPDMNHLGCFMQIKDTLLRYDPIIKSKHLPHYAMEWAAFVILQYLEKNEN
jgi:nicotinamide-nucleotide amidase